MRIWKCQFEAYETEIGVTLHELSHMIAKLPAMPGKETSYSFNTFSI